MVGPNCFHILNFLIEISLELILYWETTNNTIYNIYTWT